MQRCLCDVSSLKYFSSVFTFNLCSTIEFCGTFYDFFLNSTQYRESLQRRQFFVRFRMMRLHSTVKATLTRVEEPQASMSKLYNIFRHYILRNDKIYEPLKNKMEKLKFACCCCGMWSICEFFKPLLTSLPTASSHELVILIFLLLKLDSARLKSRRCAFLDIVTTLVILFNLNLMLDGKLCSN